LITGDKSILGKAAQSKHPPFLFTIATQPGAQPRKEHFKRSIASTRLHELVLQIQPTAQKYAKARFACTKTDRPASRFEKLTNVLSPHGTKVCPAKRHEFKKCIGIRDCVVDSNISCLRICTSGFWDCHRYPAKCNFNSRPTAAIQSLGHWRPKQERGVVREQFVGACVRQHHFQRRIFCTEYD
jgi:hypothetical protein